MKIRDLMETEVVTIGQHDDLRRVDDIMIERLIHHLPVVEDDAIIGLVTQGDMFKAQISSTMGYCEMSQRAFLHTLLVKDIMTHPVITIDPETTVDEAIDLMMSQEIGCLPVVQNNQLLGIVTIKGLLQHLRTLSPTES